MIQLNLLPDVKLQYIKAQRMRAMVLSSAIIIAIGAVALLVMLIMVGGLQKKHISDLNDDIKKDTTTLEKKQDIAKILTVQNQLQSLTQLHEQKPVVANMFRYLNQITPTDASISDFRIDFTTQAVSINGTAGSLSAVNKYVDTIKYTKFVVDGQSDEKPAFKDVVLTGFGLSGSGKKGHNASYSITFLYDPAIFAATSKDGTNKVELSVPNLTTTRASLDQPAGDIFQSAPSRGEN